MPNSRLLVRHRTCYAPGHARHARPTAAEITCSLSRPAKHNLGVVNNRSAYLFAPNHHNCYFFRLVSNTDLPSLCDRVGISSILQLCFAFREKGGRIQAIRPFLVKNNIARHLSHISRHISQPSDILTERATDDRQDGFTGS